MTRVAPQGYRFVRTPGWIASHIFAGTLILSFVWAGFWQLDRLNLRQAENEIIEARAAEEPVTLDEVLGLEAEQLSYIRIEDTGRYLDAEVIRVANRSQDGLGGDWIVALYETTDDRLLLVNRGFATRDAEAVALDPNTPIAGWLQASQVKDGVLGATDTGEGERVPRLDIAAITSRLGLDRPIAPAWLQLDDPNAEGDPQPVPLPSIDERNHFSYAMQWFIFASLSIVVYGLLLRKKAAEIPEELAESG
ncbi:MAG: cytochrome oxidase assembly protein ShyY1 [Acidimicrobiales bacterium]|jgi:cytochrome oxidase assembly protein ShyY1